MGIEVMRLGQRSRDMTCDQDRDKDINHMTSHVIRVELM